MEHLRTEAIETLLKVYHMERNHRSSHFTELKKRGLIKSVLVAFKGYHYECTDKGKELIYEMVKLTKA